MASLTPAVGLTIGAIASAGAAVAIGSAAGAPGLAGPVFGGMAGPLVAVVATWIAVVRVYRRDPAGLIRMMLKAFLIKMIFFVAYVVVMITVADLPVRAFGISFVAFFITLYSVEAALLSRLHRGSLQGGR